jgi:hypothetical protein
MNRGMTAEAKGWFEKCVQTDPLYRAQIESLGISDGVLLPEHSLSSAARREGEDPLAPGGDVQEPLFAGSREKKRG